MKKKPAKKIKKIRKPAKKPMKKGTTSVSRSKKKTVMKKIVKGGGAFKASLAKTAAGKPIGTVTHFFTEISVAIVQFKQNVPAGTLLHFKGATTDFKQPAKSMQFDHAPVVMAKKGKQIGIKVKKRVREGDAVHKG